MIWDPTSVTALLGEPRWVSHEPHPALAAHVSAFWAVSYPQGLHRIRVLPDACVDLTIIVTGSPCARITGPHPVPHVFEFEGPLELIGARLLPGASSLLGIASETLGDGWLPLEGFLDAHAVAALVTSVVSGLDVSARLAAFEAFLSPRLLNRALDPRLARALERMFEEGGRLDVAALSRHAGAHPRTLARLFERAVGLSPKRFARVVRFQAALRKLASEQNWARLAAELGYCDQAHFIREMRELFGATPCHALEQLATAPTHWSE